MLLNFFSNLSDKLAIFLIAMLPGVESKVSIPIAVLKLNISYEQALALSFWGSFLMGGLFFILFRFLFEFLIKKINRVKMIWKKTIGKIKEKKAKFFEIAEVILLLLLIIIPLPGFGIFLGAIAAAILQTRILKFMVCALIGIIFSEFLIIALVVGLKL